MKRTDRLLFTGEVAWIGVDFRLLAAAGFLQIGGVLWDFLVTPCSS